MDWTELEERIGGCTRCGLCMLRKHPVVGEGDRHARLMLVGEAPGATEDLEGRPFVGLAGQLLDKMLEAIQLPRESVYITNVCKCRPVYNRNPTAEEMAACLPYLRWQVKLIHPAMIVCMGTTAVKAIIGPDTSVSRVRGQLIERSGYVLGSIYHPAALLRDERLKVQTWHDLQAISKKLKELDDGQQSR